MNRNLLVGTAGRSKWWPIVLLTLASFVYVGVNVPKHREFSPFDEYVYLDYLDKIPTQLVVHEHEQVGDYARNEISCRGVVGFGEFGQACDSGSHRDGATYPYSGYTGADIYSPVYFAVTWAFAQPLTWVGLDLLDAGRLVGSLWLAAGLALAYSAMRELRTPQPLAAGLCLIVMVTPAVYWATTYLSTDAPSLAAGGALVLLALRITKRKTHPAWLIPLSAILVLLKVQNLAAVLLAALLVAGVALWEAYSGPSGRRLLSRFPVREVVLAGAAVAAGVVTQVAWLAVRAAIALPEVVSAGADTDKQPLSKLALVTESFRYVFKIGMSDLPSGVTGMVAANVLTLLSIAGVIGIVVAYRSGPKRAVVLGAASTLVGLTIGPALAVSTLLLAGAYFPLPVRYGIVLIPAFVICAAALLSGSRRLGLAALSVGVIMALVVIVV